MYQKLFSFLACLAMFCSCQNEDLLSEQTSRIPTKGNHRVIMVVDGDTLTNDESGTRASKVINNATVSGIGTYSHGANVTVSATPKSGYFITAFKVLVGSATCNFSSTGAKGTIEAITEDVTFHVETLPLPIYNVRVYNGYLQSTDAGSYNCPRRIIQAKSPGYDDEHTAKSMSEVFGWRYTEARVKDGSSYYSNTAGPTLKTSFTGINGTIRTSTNKGATSVGTEGRLTAQNHDMLVVYSFQEIGDYSQTTWPSGVTVPFLMGSENSSTITDKYYETDYELTYYSPKAGSQCRFVNSVISDFNVYQCAAPLVYNSSTKSYSVQNIVSTSTTWTTDYSEHYLYEDIKAGNAIDLKRMKLKLIDLRKRSQITSFTYCNTTKQADLEIDFSGLTWNTTYRCWYVTKQIPGTTHYVIAYVMQGNARKTMRDMFSGKTSSSLQTWTKASGNQIYIALKYTNSATDINPQSGVTWFY